MTRMLLATLGECRLANCYRLLRIVMRPCHTNRTVRRASYIIIHPKIPSMRQTGQPRPTCVGWVSTGCSSVVLPMQNAREAVQHQLREHFAEFSVILTAFPTDDRLPEQHEADGTHSDVQHERQAKRHEVRVGTRPYLVGRAAGTIDTDHGCCLTPLLTSAAGRQAAHRTASKSRCSVTVSTSSADTSSREFSGDQPPGPQFA